MKFSIIVPVYNIEHYILKCLKSIANQTYKNYEVIIVNDGSQDNSEKIIKDFILNKKNFKYYKKKNGGLSSARNYGLKYISGDYLLFIDGDDYINKDLLKELSKEIDKNSVDIVKYNLQFINNRDIRIMKKNNFCNLDINSSLKLLFEDEMVEPIPLYCFKVSFWQKFNFQFANDRYHEDFGLTPLIIMNAKIISSIDYVGYNYVIRDNSIMTSNNKEKLLKKFNDCFYFYEQNIVLIDKCQNINEYNKKIIKSYYVNGLISRLKTLDKDNYNKMLKVLQNNNVFNNLISDTLIRKIKKVCYKFFPKIFI